MSESNTNGGMSVGSILLIVFIVLKLTDNIDWTWWWVLSPRWITTILLVIALGVAGIMKM